VLLILLGGCADDGPAEMRYGEDQCAYCRMNVADAAFGTQLVTGKGKVFRFDSIECLAAFEMTNPDDQNETRRWLADLNRPGTFLSLDEAFIVHGRELRSPMGLGLAATASTEAGRRLAAKTKGDILSWNEVLTYVAEAWDVDR
jgi:copper chaperone NosL